MNIMTEVWLTNSLVKDIKSMEVFRIEKKNEYHDKYDWQIVLSEG